MNIVLCMDCCRELKTKLDIGDRRVRCKRCYEQSLLPKPKPVGRYREVREHQKANERYCRVCRTYQHAGMFAVDHESRRRVQVCQTCVSEGKAGTRTKAVKATDGFPGWGL